MPILVATGLTRTNDEKIKVVDLPVRKLLLADWLHALLVVKRVPVEMLEIGLI